MRKVNAAVENLSMFNAGNFFELLNIKPDFEIDQDLLDQNYLKLQQILHPDKLTTKSNAEKLMAMEYVTKLNHAYKTLKNNKTRAEYLLSLNNIIINQEDGNNVNLDPIMLAEILELSEDPNLEDIEGMIKECWNNFKCSYSKGELQQAAQAIIKLQYLSKINLSLS
jgi:molecular chaperone HscB